MTRSEYNRRLQGSTLTGITLLRPSQILVQGVKQPSEKGDWITLLRHRVLSLAPLRHFLQEFVWTCLRLEQSRVPYPLGERTKPLD